MNEPAMNEPPVSERDRPQGPMVGRRPKGEFFDRLWHYLIGVAIGCVLVGLLLTAKAKMQHQRQQQQQQQAVPPTTSQAPAAESDRKP